MKKFEIVIHFETRLDLIHALDAIGSEIGNRNNPLDYIGELEGEKTDIGYRYAIIEDDCREDIYGNELERK